jgi:hypothetical protein
METKRYQFYKLNLIRYIILSVVFLIPFGLRAIIQPQKIKCSGYYVQPKTSVIFPASFGKYERVCIYKFDNDQNDIGVTYIDNNHLKITVYIYQAGEGVENRLRSEFFTCQKDISSAANHKFRSFKELISYSKGGYKINGIYSEMILGNSNTFLWLYECGEWFFKIRITPAVFGSRLAAEKAHQDMLKQFQLIDLVKIAPLIPRARISMKQIAYKDSLILGCQLNSAMAKSKWAMEHIDSLERVSGFPGLYLDMQVAGLKKILEFASEHPEMQRSTSTDEYLTELQLINENAFLNEFICEQFMVPMIGGENKVEDYKEYLKWKKNNSLKINLNDLYYDIYYDTQTKSKSLSDSVDVLILNNIDSCINIGFDSLQTNSFLIVTKIDKANEDYIQILCNRLKNYLTNKGIYVRLLYTTNSDSTIWSEIERNSMADKVLLLIPDKKFSANTFVGFGEPKVTLKRKYAVKILNQKTRNLYSNQISISYRDDRVLQTVEKAYEAIKQFMIMF